MIYICEPICQNASHESFNSGFIKGLRERYTRVVFFADITHINAIVKYFQLRNINKFDNISFNKWHLPKHLDDIRSYFSYDILFCSVLDQVILNNDNKILFLTSSPITLNILLRYSKKKRYRNIIFNIVLHGQIEELVKKTKDNKIGIITKQKKARRFFSRKHFKSAVKKTLDIFHFKNIYHSINNLVDIMFKKITILLIGDIKSFFSTRNDLSAFNFILLSRNGYDNIQKYITNSTFKRKLLYLPCIFPKNLIKINNEYPKFAIFGYGSDNGFFERFLSELSVLKPREKYEIRLISMRYYPGIDKYENVTCPIKGFIPRDKMEELAEDIDYFLNFYDKKDYVLSCSGSIIEAIMHEKPVIYLNNPSYDSFNNLGDPIGIKAETIDSFAMVVFKIIENWPNDIENIMGYKKNIQQIKKLIDITNQLSSDNSIIA